MSIDQLKSAFSYNPQTGEILRNVRPERPAGYIMGSGYRLITLNKQPIYAHRLAWVLMTDQWPTEEIDHINQNKSDNRWINLRLANRQENARNQAVRKTSRSGFKGVSFHKRTGTWRADIFVGDHQVSLGHFEQPELAAAAYESAAIQHFGAFASV